MVWYRLIHDSKQIRRARCFTPVEWENICLEHGTSTRKNTPVYERGAKLQVHPLLLTTYSIDTRYGRHTNRFRLLEHRPRTYEKKAAEFATKPRCQMIGVEVESGWRDGSCECVVYVKDGIRIRDLLDVARKLLQQEKAIASLGSGPVFAYGKIAEVVGED